MNTNVLTHIPSHCHDRIRIFTEIICFKLGLIKQQQQIPIRGLVGIATGTRAIKV